MNDCAERAAAPTCLVWEPVAVASVRVRARSSVSHRSSCETKAPERAFLVPEDVTRFTPRGSGGLNLALASRIVGTLLVLAGLASEAFPVMSGGTLLWTGPGGEPVHGALNGEAISVLQLGTLVDRVDGVAFPSPAVDGESAEPAAFTDARFTESPQRSPSWTPITRIRMDRIGLDAEVVASRFRPITRDWAVPPFKAGHAELTAGAGEAGNSVILGHVTSQNAGNVFRDLQLARLGDPVDVWSGTERFSYSIVEVRTVSRTDRSVLDHTGEPSVSFITCAGIWLPQQRDYSERLVVRGVLNRSETA